MGYRIIYLKERKESMVKFEIEKRLLKRNDPLSINGMAIQTGDQFLALCKIANLWCLFPFRQRNKNEGCFERIFPICIMKHVNKNV